MRTSDPKIVFVYNANSGIGNTLLDAAHKVLRPATYPCSLCQLIYGPIREKKNWRLFKERFDTPMRFLHKDEFIREYSDRVEFPAIFLEEKDNLKMIVSAEVLDAMKDEMELSQKLGSILGSPDPGFTNH